MKSPVALHAKRHAVIETPRYRFIRAMRDDVMGVQIAALAIPAFLASVAIPREYLSAPIFLGRDISAALPFLISDIGIPVRRVSPPIISGLTQRLFRYPAFPQYPVYNLSRDTELIGHRLAAGIWICVKLSDKVRININAVLGRFSAFCIVMVAKIYASVFQAPVYSRSLAAHYLRNTRTRHHFFKIEALNLIHIQPEMVSFNGLSLARSYGNAKFPSKEINMLVTATNFPRQMRRRHEVNKI